MITGATRVAAVIGHPVRHSLSPALHNAGFAATGVPWVYLAFDVAPGAAAEALRAMRTLGLGGLSVTMPHKHDVADAVDELDEASAMLGSVNTVVPLADGRLKGYSTDGDGFIASLVEQQISVAGRSIAVIGAGGAGRAIIDALRRAGAGRIAIINRTDARARDAAVLGGDRAVVGGDADIASADIVVNTTSVGMAGGSGDHGAETPCDPTLLHAAQVVADIVYHPRQTALLTAAASVGAHTVDGLGMLVHQAVLQQVLFTGQTPSAATMRAAAERELLARGQ